MPDRRPDDHDAHLNDRREQLLERQAHQEPRIGRQLQRIRCVPLHERIVVGRAENIWTQHAHGGPFHRDSNGAPLCGEQVGRAWHTVHVCPEAGPIATPSFGTPCTACVLALTHATLDADETQVVDPDADDRIDIRESLERSRADRAKHSAEGRYKTNIRIARNGGAS